MGGRIWTCSSPSRPRRMAATRQTTYQGPLMELPVMNVWNQAGLAPGRYGFFFGVDLNPNGLLDFNDLYYDQVTVTIQDQE